MPRRDDEVRRAAARAPLGDGAADAARSAYCDKLGAPKPAVCAHVDAIPEDEQQYTEWNELRQAILTHDIGPSATAIVLAGPARPR